MNAHTLALALSLAPLVYLLTGLSLYFLLDALGRAPVDAEVAKRGESALIGARMRQAFTWTVGPFERLFTTGGVSPDVLTLIGCGLCCSGSVVIAAGELTIGGMMVLVSSAFDFLDGRIARKLGSASRGGEFLDSTLDRYSDAFCFGAAAFLLRENPWHLTASLVGFGAAAVVPYARAKAEALGIGLKSGLMQRPERVVVYSAAAVFSAPLDPLWPAAMEAGHPTFATIIWMLAAATAWTAIGRTTEGLRRLRN